MSLFFSLPGIPLASKQQARKHRQRFQPHTPGKHYFEKNFVFEVSRTHVLSQKMMMLLIIVQLEEHVDKGTIIPANPKSKLFTLLFDLCSNLEKYASRITFVGCLGFDEIFEIFKRCLGNMIWEIHFRKRNLLLDCLKRKMTPV